MFKYESSAGEFHRNAKLTETKVRRIRHIYDRGGRGKKYAERFDISPQNFNAIGRRKRWEHVT